MNISSRGSIMLKFLFVMSVIFYFVFFNTQKPRILILHSYANDYTWVTNVNDGLARAFGNRTDFSTHWQYMNTKNHPTVSYKQKMGVLVRRLISRLQPSIIIAIDDDAQEFVAKFYVDDPKITVVFGGVNGELNDYGYINTRNVTGILERVPFAAVRDTFIYLVGSKKKPEEIKFINLGDNSSTVRLDEKQLLNFNWSPVNLIDSVLVEDFHAWKEAVKEIEKRADVLFITNYRQLVRKKGEERFIPPREVMEWTVKNSKIPVVGGNGFVTEDGAYISVGASPYEQGNVAGEMALKVLAGTPAYKIPIQTTEQFLVYMRKDMTGETEKKLPLIYEAFARGIGKFYGRAVEIK